MVFFHMGVFDLLFSMPSLAIRCLVLSVSTGNSRCASVTEHVCNAFSQLCRFDQRVLKSTDISTPSMSTTLSLPVFSRTISPHTALIHLRVLFNMRPLLGIVKCASSGSGFSRTYDSFPGRLVFCLVFLALALLSGYALVRDFLLRGGQG